MLNKSRIKQDFNRAALEYDTHARLQRHVANGLFNRINGHFHDKDTILDTGAGTGYFQELARKHGNRWTIYQLDIAYTMCMVANRYASLPEYGLTFTVNADTEALPFASQSMQGIFSSLMLQWVSDMEKAFAESYRVLNYGSYAFFSTLIPGTLHELHTAFLQTGFRSPVCTFYDRDMITDTMKKAGFNAIETQAETLQLPYDSLLHLMRSLKGVGAQNKSSPNQFIGKKGLTAIEAYYKKQFGSITAHWEILYVAGKK